MTEDIDVKRLRLGPGDIVVATIPESALDRLHDHHRLLTTALAFAGHGSVPVVFKTESTDLMVVGGPPTDREGPATELLDWLETRTDLDLSWNDAIDSADHPDTHEGWVVHQKNSHALGPEWSLVAIGATPYEAIREAHKAFCDGR